MSFNVVPFGSAQGPQSGAPAQPVRTAAPQGSTFADVVDLASRREAADHAPEIPDHVWDEVDAAARLWHELRTQDREVRFDTHAVSGRVVASLCDLDGGVVRRLPLRETFGFDGPETAA